jgi:cephalosporin hydroxylase
VRFTTDKIGHGYLPTYLAIAASLAGRKSAICEVGVASGEGLAMFQALVPDAVVVGVDISEQAKWPDGTRRVVLPQNDPRLPAAIREAAGVDRFDLIVDDASHLNHLTRATLGMLWPLVVPDGWYVIEDWSHCDLMMGQLAEELPGRFRESLHDDLAELVYRPGLIIMRKRP